MSKIVTDSDVLMNFLFDGTAPDDTPVHCLIESLKKATLDCAEMRVTVGFEETETLRKRVSDIEFTLVETWRTLLAMENEFRDLIEESFTE